MKVTSNLKKKFTNEAADFFAVRCVHFFIFLVG